MVAGRRALQLLVLWVGLETALAGNGKPVPFITTFLNQQYGGVPEPAHGNCSAHDISRGHPACRSGPHWCPLPRAKLGDAPPTLHGALPCSLPSVCKVDELRFFASTKRLSSCLANKRIVAFGDSVVTELVSELMVLVGRREPEFISKWLDYGYKQIMDPVHNRVAAGSLSVDMYPHQRNMTFRDAELNLTIDYLFSGHHNISLNHGGLGTLVHPEFVAQLGRFGLLPNAPPEAMPDFLLIGTTFHDDENLSGPCDNSCGCAVPFSTMQSKLEASASAVASWLSGLSSLGVKASHGGPDYLRALADDVMHRALAATSFFQTGGVFLDLWPLHYKYFQLVAQHVATFGPSSLHYSPMSIRDCFLLPDLSAMRVQLNLNALCSSRPSAASPCGTGSHFAPQAAAVRASKAMCSCGFATMSINSIDLCNASASPLRPRNANAPLTRQRVDVNRFLQSTGYSSSI